MNAKDDRDRKRPPPPEPDPPKPKAPVDELDLSFDEEVFDRVTQRPAAGPEKYAAEVMRRSGELHEPPKGRGMPTPLSLPPALSGSPGADDETNRKYDAEQQDKSQAISFPALEMPSISPASVQNRTNEPASDPFGGPASPSWNDADDLLPSDIPDEPERLDLVDVPHLPRNPPPATNDLDPLHAALSREDRATLSRDRASAKAAPTRAAAPASSPDSSDSDLPPALGGLTLDSDLPPALGGGADESELPPALGGGTKRRVPLSEVPSVLAGATDPLAFVDKHSHPPADIASSDEFPPALTPSRVPSSELAALSEPPTSQRLRERYALGDFSGALDIAEAILTQDPDSAEAGRFAKSCREVLTQMYTARLSPLTQRPRVAVAPDQIRWLSLDHRAGFLLSLVDGISTMEEILDVCGMARMNALRILCSLVEQNVIELE